MPRFESPYVAKLPRHASERGAHFGMLRIEWYSRIMSSMRARVQGGRLVLDEPTALPEGTVLDLVVDDEGDELDEEERAVLSKAISIAWESVRAGHTRPATEILERLASKR